MKPPVPINQVFHGDCIEGMKQIPAGSVDLVITDCCRYLYRSGTSNIKTL